MCTQPKHISWIITTSTLSTNRINVLLAILLIGISNLLIPVLNYSVYDLAVTNYLKQQLTSFN